MTQRVWSSLGSTDTNDPINWTGAGALLDTDTLILDATSVVGCSLSGNLGAWTWDNETGTVSGVTLGCAGIVIEAGYTGTLNLGTHRLALGDGGLDCSAASAATVVGSAGSEIYVEGPSSGLAAFSLDGLAAYTLSNTLLYRSGRVELRGKAYSSSAIAQTMVSTVGSYAMVSADTYVLAGGREFGTVDVAAGCSYYHKAMELMSTGQITGGGRMIMMIGGEPTVDPAAVIDVAAVFYYLYTGLGVVPAGTWSCGLFTIYFLTSDSYQIVPVGFADGVRFECDLHITYSWQGTTAEAKEARLDFGEDCTLAGDLTHSVTSGLVV